jgi:GAF domain-containing protein
MIEFITKSKCIRSGRSYAGSAAMKAEASEHQSREMKVNRFKNKNTYKGKSLVEYSFKVLSAIARENGITQGAFFVPENTGSRHCLKFLTGFAGPEVETNESILEFGRGFHGQVAEAGKLLNISDLTADQSFKEAGFGRESAVSLLVFPVKHDDKVLAVIELASFRRFDKEDELFFEEISGSIAGEIIKCRA